jgi:hypothetical protein
MEPRTALPDSNEQEHILVPGMKVRPRNLLKSQKHAARHSRHTAWAGLSAERSDSSGAWEIIVSGTEWGKQYGWPDVSF